MRRKRISQNIKAQHGKVFYIYTIKRMIHSLAKFQHDIRLDFQVGHLNHHPL